MKRGLYRTVERDQKYSYKQNGGNDIKYLHDIILNYDHSKNRLRIQENNRDAVLLDPDGRLYEIRHYLYIQRSENRPVYTPRI